MDSSGPVYSPFIRSSAASAYIRPHNTRTRTTDDKQLNEFGERRPPLIVLSQHAQTSARRNSRVSTNCCSVCLLLLLLLLLLPLACYNAGLHIRDAVAFNFETV